MITDYLNQSATWKRVTSLNEYGEPITTSQVVKIRWEGKRKLVRNRQGQEVISEALFFCLEAVQPGDLMEYGGREWPIITVAEATDLDGNIVYREAAC